MIWPRLLASFFSIIVLATVACSQDASEITHQAIDPSDWTAPHEEVDGKLDELGDRVNTLEETAGVTIDYFFSDTSSNVGGDYFDMTNDDLGGAESTLSTAGLGTGNDQPLVNFVTLAGEPALTQLLKGIYDLHIHATKTAGTKPVTIYGQLYSRTGGGTETLQSTSETSSAITAVQSEHDLHMTISANVTIGATDRLVIKWFANVGQTGSAATVTLAMEGDLDSHFALPTTTDILSDIFVRQDGTKELSANWDAGPFKITALQLASDIATGDPPFTVASTTVVASLNVDQVDGKDETEFVLVDGTRALTGNWGVGGFDFDNVGGGTFDSITGGDATLQITGLAGTGGVSVSGGTNGAGVGGVTNFSGGVGSTSGGDIFIFGGDGGTDGGDTFVFGGDGIIGDDGTVFIGDAQTSQVDIGDGTIVVSILGDAVVGFTPTTLADWDGSADPGDMNDALDELAERAKDIEQHNCVWLTLGYPAESSTDNFTLEGTARSKSGDGNRRGHGPMMYAGSVIGMQGVVDVNAYVSGDVEFDIRIGSGAGLTTKETMAFGVTGIANGYAQNETYALGAVPFSVGDFIQVRRAFDSGVGITTDDMQCGLLIALDGVF